MAEEEEETTVEASLEEILARRAEETNEEEASILDLDRGEEKAETLTIRVLPQQQNEFTCRKCFLVKHQSQLVDKKKKICRDCA